MMLASDSMSLFKPLVLPEEHNLYSTLLGILMGAPSAPPVMTGRLYLSAVPHLIRERHTLGR